MTGSRDVMEAAGERVAAYCAQRSSPDDYRIEHSIRGTSITIVERRPPWNPAFGSEWSSTNVAQLRHDESGQWWTLYSARSDDRWHRHDFVQPASDVAPLLAAIETDATGMFWADRPRRHLAVPVGQNMPWLLFCGCRICLFQSDAHVCCDDGGCRSLRTPDRRR